jgi:N-acetyl-alpha-D-glucosaminyl L-malate synthase BshA
MATELGIHLARRGHKVHFITSEVPFRLIGGWRKNVYFHRVEEASYPLFKNDELYPLILANKVAKIVEEEGLQVVHAHYAIPHATSLFMANEVLSKKVKTVVTLHGTDVTIFGSDPTLHGLTKLSLGKCSAVTAVCKFLASKAEQVYSLENVDVIYNFVSIKKDPIAKSSELREVFSKPNEKIVIHCSNFREVKRVGNVLEIFAKINKKIPSKLLLIGDGPEKGLAQKMAAKLKVIDRVHFMGLQDNISRLLSISDLMLLPSEKEAFSLSALEAMSCGVAVIATNVGGMNEMIKSGEEGFLSEIGDVEEMSNNAIRILENKKFFMELTRAASQKVKDNFTPEIITAKYEEIFKRVLD